MRAMTVVYVLAAVAIGAFVVVQASVNGKMRVQLGDPWHAALISTSVSTLFLMTLATIAKGRPVPEMSKFTGAPWWVWTGGLLGAVYVAVALVLVTRLGSSVLFALVILGQMIAAMVMDHFGLIGLPRHEINPPRILGALLLVAGVALIRLF